MIQKISETVSNANARIYRPIVPSDLPKIQSGKLKAFSGVERCPAKLVSTNGWTSTKAIANIWLVEAPLGDYVRFDDVTIVVDVTPEKRWAIWYKPSDRFSRLGQENVVTYSSKTDAEVAIAEYCRKTALTADKYFSVVEFDYPGEDKE